MNPWMIIVLMCVVLLIGGSFTAGAQKDVCKVQRVIKDGYSFRVDGPEAAPSEAIARANRLILPMRNILRLEHGKTPDGGEAKEGGKFVVFHGQESPRPILKTPSYLKSVEIVGNDEHTLKYLAEFSGKYSPDQADCAEELALEMARVELGLAPGNSGKGFVVKRIFLDKHLISFEIEYTAVKILGE